MCMPWWLEHTNEVDRLQSCSKLWSAEKNKSFCLHWMLDKKIGVVCPCISIHLSWDLQLNLLLCLSEFCSMQAFCGANTTKLCSYKSARLFVLAKLDPKEPIHRRRWNHGLWMRSWWLNQTEITRVESWALGLALSQPLSVNTRTLNSSAKPLA